MNSLSPESVPFLDLVLRRTLRCAAYLAGTAAALVVFLAFYVAMPACAPSLSPPRRDVRRFRLFPPRTMPSA